MADTTTIYTSSGVFQIPHPNKTKCHGEGSLEERAIQHLFALADQGHWVNIQVSWGVPMEIQNLVLKKDNDYKKYLESVCKLGEINNF